MNLPWVKTANKIFIGVLAVQFLLAVGIGIYTDTLFVGLIFGAPILALPLFLITKFPNLTLTHIVVGIAVQLMTALHIQQSFGLTEIHFEIFVVLAFLSYYRNWMVIGASTAIVAVHHILFFILQSNDTPIYVFEEGHLSFSILVIHALFAVAEGGVLMFVSKMSHQTAIASLKLSNSVNEILSDGDSLNLAIKLDDDNEDMKPFNRIIRSIGELIKQTSEVSQKVTRVSKRVSTLSGELQESMATSSVQVNSIASSSEEMSTTISNVAANANNANRIAGDTKSDSINAKTIIETTNNDVTALKSDLSQTSGTINSLSEKCDRISQVMDAIKVVSEQTNLLALNAAIESARAGEHGRGFAVVADEVRQLAIKTRESVEEISEVSAALIQDGNTSVEQMKQCLNSADQAMKATSNACDLISKVSEGISEVETNISEVASSTEEQSLASTTIATSAVQLHDLSQREVESIEASALEVEELNRNTQLLEQQLSKFNV